MKLPREGYYKLTYPDGSWEAIRHCGAYFERYHDDGSTYYIKASDGCRLIRDYRTFSRKGGGILTVEAL